MRESTRELYKNWDELVELSRSGSGSGSSLSSSTGPPSPNINDVEDQLVSLCKSTSSGLKFTHTVDTFAEVQELPQVETLPFDPTLPSSSFVSDVTSSSLSSSAPRSSSDNVDELSRFITRAMSTQSLLDEAIITKLEDNEEDNFEDFYRQVQGEILKEIKQVDPKAGDASDLSSLSRQADFYNALMQSYMPIRSLQPQVEDPVVSVVSLKLTTGSVAHDASQSNSHKKRKWVKSIVKRVSERVFKKKEEKPKTSILGNKYVPVINPDLMTRFNHKREELRSQGRDTNLHLVYHGTDVHAADSIAEMGFIIPQLSAKKGTVSNGSCFGVGVYASSHLPVAWGYKKGAFIVSVCVLGKSTSSHMRTLDLATDPSLGYDFDSFVSQFENEIDDVVVIHDPAAILPLYIFHI